MEKVGTQYPVAKWVLSTHFSTHLADWLAFNEFSIFSYSDRGFGIPVASSIMYQVCR